LARARYMGDTEMVHLLLANGAVDDDGQAAAALPSVPPTGEECRRTAPAFMSPVLESRSGGSSGVPGHVRGDYREAVGPYPPPSAPSKLQLHELTEKQVLSLFYNWEYDHYLPAFREHHVDGTMLTLYETKEDLHAIGIYDETAASKLLQLIRLYKERGVLVRDVEDSNAPTLLVEGVPAFARSGGLVTVWKCVCILKLNLPFATSDSWSLEAL